MEKQQIFELMGKVMADINPIAKASRNKEQGFDYRGIDDIYNALHAIFAKHGVFVTKEIIASQRMERTTTRGTTMYVSIVDYRFWFNAPDGSRVSTEERGEAMDSGDKASGKSASIAMKYALMHSLLIPTKEEKDPDASSHEPTMPQPKAAPEQSNTIIPIELQAKIVNAPAGTTREQFSKLYTAHVKQPYAAGLSQLIAAELEKRGLKPAAK